MNKKLKQEKQEEEEELRVKEEPEQDSRGSIALWPKLPQRRSCHGADAQDNAVPPVTVIGAVIAVLPAAGFQLLMVLFIL